MNCTDCKWNSEGSCLQGHVRWNRDKRWVIENCHSWKEKEKPPCWWCEDWKRFEDEFKGSHAWGQFYEVVKKLIGLNPVDPECPNCGKKFKQEK